jgi:hypothetical protein
MPPLGRPHAFGALDRGQKKNPAAGDRGARQEFSDKSKPADNSEIADAAQEACHLIIDSATTGGEWPLGEIGQWEFAGISSAGEVHWRRLRIGTGDPIIIRAEPREPVLTEPVRVVRPGAKCPSIGGGQ